MNQKKSAPSTQFAPSSYVAQPALPTGSGVLVLHAWWGLNKFFRQLCARLAKEGFVVLAPDLYHGAIAATLEEAQKLRATLKPVRVQQDILQAAEQLRALCSAGKPIGVIGFSLGGYWALWLAEQPSIPVAATVVFYGSRNGDYVNSRSAFQFHLAESDDYVAISGVKKLQKALAAAGREAEFHTYAGTTHWFFEKDRPDAYNAPAAKLAWGRTTGFLQKYLH
jgi:carboxymethylenebutenolidase